jgi:hypothetical protein
MAPKSWINLTSKFAPRKPRINSLWPNIETLCDFSRPDKVYTKKESRRCSIALLLFPPIHGYLASSEGPSGFMTLTSLSSNWDTLAESFTKLYGGFPLGTIRRSGDLHRVLRLSEVASKTDFQWRFARFKYSEK